MDKIVLGTRSKSKTLSSLLNDEFGSKCVIYLIDRVTDMNTDDNDSDCIIDLSITDYISDQIPELWSQVKLGDLIEDISNYAIYAVDIIDHDSNSTEQPNAKSIVRNEFDLVELEWSDEDGEYLIPAKFYAITKFPLGYHDYSNMMIINTHAPAHNESVLDWPSSSKIPLDHAMFNESKLKNIITCSLYDRDFCYVIISHKSTNYLIGTDSTKDVLSYKLRKTYQTPYYSNMLKEYLGSLNLDALATVLSHEKIKIENLLVI